MAFENLFIRTNRTLGGIQMDATISEDHSEQTRITSNPVEFGPDISDHVIIEPAELTVVGVVSDTPLGLAALDALTDSIADVFGGEISNGGTRSQQAYEAMLQLKNNREPIVVSTKLKEYQNMVVSGVNTFQDKSSSHVANMRISFKEVIITESEFIEVSKEDVNSEVAASATTASERGRINTVVPDENKQQSWLNSIIDWAN